MKRQPSKLTSALPLDKALSKDEEWLSLKDETRHLKISRSTVNRLVQANKIPSLKLGGTLVFPKHLINNILQNQALQGFDINNQNQ